MRKSRSTSAIVGLPVGLLQARSNKLSRILRASGFGRRLGPLQALKLQFWGALKLQNANSWCSGV